MAIENFDEMKKRFDRDFDRAKKQYAVWSVIIGIGVLLMIGFVVWVIIMFMLHFGVI